MRINKTELRKEFTEAVKDMVKDRGMSITYFWILGSDRNNNWALVLGWGEEDYDDGKDEFLNEGYRLSAKIAYQSKQSVMKDYDYDWTMPFDEITNEVDDCERGLYSFDDIDEVLNYLTMIYEQYAKEKNLN